MVRMPISSLEKELAGNATSANRVPSSGEDLYDILGNSRLSPAFLDVHNFDKRLETLHV